MVLCWIALPVFAILALFSARYRRLTWESLECMFRTVTLRKCQSGLDDRIRSDITGRLMRISPKTAKFFYVNYKAIAFILIILFLWSAYFSGIAIYNYAVHGNCNGPNSNGFCIIEEAINGFQEGDVASCESDELTEIPDEVVVEQDNLPGCGCGG